VVAAVLPVALVELDALLEGVVADWSGVVDDALLDGAVAL